MVRRDINEEHTLVSYFVPLKEQYDLTSIREHLKTKLPTYAIPKSFLLFFSPEKPTSATT